MVRFKLISSAGTPDIPQTGAVGEPTDDDIAIGCTLDGFSALGLY